MARIKGPLAEKVVAKLAGVPGRHAVGGVPGLYLCVEGNGRSWFVRYSLDGRRRDCGIGSYADLTLSEAREKARQVRKTLRQGIDPIEQRRNDRHSQRLADAKRATFSECVKAYISGHGDAWRNPKHRQQWANTLSAYADPLIGALDVASIDTGLILRVLEPIWKAKTETASRVRGRIEAVLDWATVRGYRTGDNPARWKGHLDKLLPAPSKIAKVEHHAALPYREISEFLLKLRKQDGMGARALEFAILTATRSGEVRGATWEEVDLEARLWIIPAARMKAGRDHRVPLSEEAAALLDSLPKAAGFVFPSGRKDKPLSDMTLTAVLRRMGRADLTAHGFRSTFRDWCAEATNYPHEVAEMALAHVINNKVEAAYRRGDLFEKRAQMMAEWAAFCVKPVSLLPEAVNR